MLSVGWQKRRLLCDYGAEKEYGAGHAGFAQADRGQGRIFYGARNHGQFGGIWLSAAYSDFL